MTTALYRRYRPDTFQDVIGQDHVTHPLMAALRGDRVTHAYLFSGPRGCGKTTSARILARCLNCEQAPTDTPCGICPSCRDLATGGPGSLDVVEIDAASHNGVDDARDLRERAVFAPARDRYKIFILDEAHMVTPQGFNALLKLVEEPPAHVKFIFATTEPEKVIGTIRSRTHHYPFRLVPPDTLEGYLAHLCQAEHVGVGPGVFPLVTRAGGGSVRDTLSVMDQLIGGAVDGSVDYQRAVALLGYTDTTLLDQCVDAIAAADGAGVFRVVDRVVSSGHDPRRFVEDLLQRLRDLLVISLAGEEAGPALGSMPADELSRMEVQARTLGGVALSLAADTTSKALGKMVGATSPRLQLELLMARLLVPTTTGGAVGAAVRGPVVAGVAGAASAAGAGRLAPGGSGVGGAASQPGAAAGAGAAARGNGNPAGTAPGSSGAPGSAAARAAAHGAGIAGGVAGQAGGASSVPTSTTGRPAGGAQASAPTSAAADAAASSGTHDEPQAEPGWGAPAREQAPTAPRGDQPRQSAGSQVGGNAAGGRSQQAPVSVPAGPNPFLREVPRDVPAADAASAEGAAAPGGSAPGAAASAPSRGGQSAPAGRPDAGASRAAGGAAEAEMIRQRWGEVLEAIKRERRMSWALVSPYGQPGTLEGGVFSILFPSQGLISTFEGGGHAPVVASALHQALGVQAQVRAVLSGGDGGGSRGGSHSGPNQPSGDGGWSQASAPARQAPAPAPQAPADSAIQAGGAVGPEQSNSAQQGRGRANGVESRQASGREESAAASAGAVAAPNPFAKQTQPGQSSSPAGEVEESNPFAASEPGTPPGAGLGSDSRPAERSGSSAASWGGDAATRNGSGRGAPAAAEATGSEKTESQQRKAPAADRPQHSEEPRTAAPSPDGANSGNASSRKPGGRTTAGQERPAEQRAPEPAPASKPDGPTTSAAQASAAGRAQGQRRVDAPVGDPGFNPFYEYESEWDAPPPPDDWYPADPGPASAKATKPAGNSQRGPAQSSGTPAAEASAAAPGPAAPAANTPGGAWADVGAPAPTPASASPSSPSAASPAATEPQLASVHRLHALPDLPPAQQGGNVRAHITVVHRETESDETSRFAPLAPVSWADPVNLPAAAPQASADPGVAANAPASPANGVATQSPGSQPAPGARAAAARSAASRVSALAASRPTVSLEDDIPSDDDEDAEEAGVVGIEVVKQVLGATVIEEVVVTQEGN